ncbi:hypothetical protein DFH94DRAFT_847313 [Russula ochroleuca]|uniref:Uncharacterized protein n=1 Tax=Russula ochroleuca TaxID=152965 RepID=A0A9P5JZ77_9AGAM|nr:hypothetical protein DFH94DRAFT_847313 [Russula ochroleuca]
MHGHLQSLFSYHLRLLHVCPPKQGRTVSRPLSQLAFQPSHGASGVSSSGSRPITRKRLEKVKKIRTSGGTTKTTFAKGIHKVTVSVEVYEKNKYGVTIPEMGLNQITKFIGGGVLVVSHGIEIRWRIFPSPALRSWPNILRTNRVNLLLDSRVHPSKKVTRPGQKLSPEVPMSASDTGIRDECHIDKSPLTLSNDEGITGCESGQPSAFGLYHSGIGGGIPDQCRVGQKASMRGAKARQYGCYSRHRVGDADLDATGYV